MHSAIDAILGQICHQTLRVGYPFAATANAVVINSEVGLH